MIEDKTPARVARLEAENTKLRSKAAKQRNEIGRLTMEVERLRDDRALLTLPAVGVAMLAARFRQETEANTSLR